MASHSTFPSGSSARLLLLLSLVLGAVFAAGAPVAQNSTGTFDAEPVYPTANANGLSGDASKAPIVFGEITATSSKVRGGKDSTAALNEAYGNKVSVNAGSCRWTGYNYYYAPKGRPFCKCSVRTFAYSVYYYGYYCDGRGSAYVSWTTKYPIKYYKTLCYSGSIGLAVCY